MRDGEIIDLTLSDDDDGRDDGHGHEDDDAQTYTAYVRLTRSDRQAGFESDESHDESNESVFFFGGMMRSRACAACRTQTFMFGADGRPTCNTCFGNTHGAVVLPSRTHGYGVFASRAARGIIEPIESVESAECFVDSNGSIDSKCVPDAIPVPSGASARKRGARKLGEAPVFPEPHIDGPHDHDGHHASGIETDEAGPVVFKEGETVMYMGGELFSEKEHGAIFGECGTPYAVSAGDGQVLDATLYRNPACYINSVLPGCSGPSSPGSCDSLGSFGPSGSFGSFGVPGTPSTPNLKMWYETDTGNVSITALRDIYDGEELFLDYGPGYAWDIGCTVTVTKDLARTDWPDGAHSADMADRPEWTDGARSAEWPDRPVVKRARTASGDTRIIVALE
ncbi:MAG: SET domain-containing protein [Chitinophagia bacterium]|nr:SET domain-containing protein [Chitinophagia bacterium]